MTTRPVCPKHPRSGVCCSTCADEQFQRDDERISALSNAVMLGEAALELGLTGGAAKAVLLAMRKCLEAKK